MTGFDVLVAGAGAAGLVAATEAAAQGARVLLLEKNRQPGAKILASGGTRCNLTHDCDVEQVVAAFGPSGRFLKPALYEFGPRDVRGWIETLGVPTKVEAGGKVFPVSNRAVDVRNAIWNGAQRAGVTIACEEGIQGITGSSGAFVVATQRGERRASRVILTTGGRSYPRTGTTGDGYPIASELGHEVVPTVPALVPLVVETEWVRSLRGVTLDDAEVSLWVDSACAERRRGSLLFTHFGLSGPGPMNLGGAVATVSGPCRVRLRCLPEEGQDDLDRELRSAATAGGSRTVRNLLSLRLPRRLVEALLQQARVPVDRQLAQCSREERRRVVAAVLGLELEVTGTAGYDKAEVTRGGVSRGDVQARSLESRRCPGLYFAGEVLDVDGPIGGYNFTAAFATGVLAGRSAAH